MLTQLHGIEEHETGLVSEVIRPAAIVPEDAARAILAALKQRSVEQDGYWVSTARQWSRYDRPGLGTDGNPAGQLVGVLEAVYGATTRYEVTIYRVTVTSAGTAAGWAVGSLGDEPLGYGGLTLATCPRAMMQPPPKPFRPFRMG